jgi:hypothetical protein
MKKRKQKVQTGKPLSLSDIVDFGLGNRLPVTEKEKALEEELKQMIKEGKRIEIPNELPS